MQAPAAGVMSPRERVQRKQAELEEVEVETRLLTARQNLEETKAQIRAPVEAQRQVDAQERAERAENRKLERQQREEQRQQMKAENEFRQWKNTYLQSALAKLLPPDTSGAVLLNVQREMEKVLDGLKGTWRSAEPVMVAKRLKAACDLVLRPAQETERAVEEGRRQLPFGIPEDWKLRYEAAAREEIRFLPADASYQEKRAAAVQAGKRIAMEYEQEQARARAEQARTQRESMKSLLISVGVGRVGPYLSTLHFRDEIFDEDLERKSELEETVRKVLEERLTGAETFEDVQRIAREIVDEKLQ